MLPFSVSEIEGQPLSDIMIHLFNHASFTQDSIRSLRHPGQFQWVKKQFEAYLEQGGLPGLCFIRNTALRRNALNDLHDLILGRDLRLVSEIKTPVSTLKRLLSYIAGLSFEIYNASEVRRILGLSPATQRKLLDAMESIFLIRRIPVPLRKKNIFLLEDQYEERIYSGGRLDKTRYLEGALYRNLRTQFSYRLDKDIRFESYLTRDHARVPIVIVNDDRSVGIIVTAEEKPTLSETRSATSFLRHHGAGKILYLSQGMSQPKILDDRSMVASIYSVL